MAITNAQQARQLYNEGGPMKKIKGQDHMLAYITPGERDTLVELGGQETMTPEGILAYPPGMGDPNYDGGGGGKKGNSNKDFNDARSNYVRDYVSKGIVKGGGAAIKDAGGNTIGYQDAGLTKNQINKSKDFQEAQKFQSNFNNKTFFDKTPSSLKFLSTLFRGNSKYKKEFAQNSPELLKALLDLTEEELQSNKAMTALKTIKNLDGQTYEDFLAFNKGAPGLKYSGNVGGLEKFVSEYEINPDGTKGKPLQFGYKEKTDSASDGMTDYERKLLALEQATAASASAATPEVEEDNDEIINYRLMAGGGRAGFKNGTSNEPVIQGGVINYLGNQKTVSDVPIKWQSGKDKPETELAYITKAEKDLLLKKDIHGSLQNGPNTGPEGIMSLDSQGDKGTYGDTGQSYGDRQITDTSPEVGDRGGGYQDPNTNRNIVDNTKALVNVPVQFVQSLFGNPFNKKGGFLTKAGLTLAQVKELENIANEKGTLKGPITNTDYGMPTNTFELNKNMTPIEIANSTTFGQGSFTKDPTTGEISLDGGNYDFDGKFGAVGDFVDAGGLMGVADKFGENLYEDQVNNPDMNYLALANGGRAGLAEGGMPYEGGIMDLESSRQMYGLGKLVKKVTRSVKKIAKSPIGKAALLYAGGSYLKGAGFLKSGGQGSIFSKLFGANNTMKGFANISTAKMPGILGKLGLTQGYGSMMPTALGGILGTSALSYFMTPEEEEEEKLASLGADIDNPSYIMNNPSLYTNRRLAAEGGSMDEPVAKKTMPLLDMEGQEKDYRETGGFVDMGRMEKADDVPARLSKNEFVFTADAVRNAGEGDVDKGAEVMYNMMKNLESGGDVSEESQGLEGARDMFKTSQRLEEVL